jgi:CheY-like chemotaxis protein
VIISAVHQASDLTRQLLGFARKGKHRVARVDVAQCVRNVNLLLKRTMDRRINVMLDLQEGIYVRGDSTQIEQVVLNLAVNARDAMPEGGHLRFILRSQDIDPEILGLARDGESLKLAVLRTEDTGCGISRENQEKIFEPFFTTKEEEGTGMGLATVYGIVINHGGWIDVSSRPGDGSVFTVYLPIDTSSTDNEEDEQVTEEPVARVSGRTILVVDDEYMVITTLMELLKELGYNVVTAPGGERAIQLFSRDPSQFDAVILDLSMPGMDGKECFEKLERLDPEVKVILATGFSKDGRVQELLDMGVMGFLQKPFRMKELAELLERIMNSGDTN